MGAVLKVEVLSAGSRAKHIAESKGVRREAESEGSRMSV